jgi:hypothetical protein
MHGSRSKIVSAVKRVVFVSDRVLCVFLRDRCFNVNVRNMHAAYIHTYIHTYIHKVINSIWIKEELPEEWKESFIVRFCKKGDKTDCSNYRGISLLTDTYKIYPISCSTS